MTTPLLNVPALTRAVTGARVARTRISVEAFDEQFGFDARERQRAENALQRALRSARRTPRVRAPKVTGALRKSMRVTLDRRRSRFVLEYRIIYANSVDLRSKRNAGYMQRVGRQAVQVCNRAAWPYWNFRFSRRVLRTTAGTGNKGWTKIYLNYSRRGQ